MKELLSTFNKLLEGKKRRAVLVAIDILIFAIVNSLYYLLAIRAAYSTPVTENAQGFAFNSLLLFIFVFAARFILKIYGNIWRYTNTKAYFMIVISDGIAGIVTLVVARIAFFIDASLYIGIWHAVSVASLMALCTLMSRFTYRLLYMKKHVNENKQSKTTSVNIAIIGAGQVGANLAVDLLEGAATCYTPKCFFDTDKTKIGQSVSGLPVYGEENVAEIIKKHEISELVIAISGGTQKTDEVFKYYSDFGCKIKIYASPLSDDGEQSDNKARVIRDFEIEDLLFRAPLNINNQAEFEYYKGKTVLVTGGGGSIGSELCRQLVKCGVGKLIIFDIYENNAYDIQQELIRKYGSSINLVVEIGSVRDVDRVDCIFDTYRPEIVFHAAAHKHVPLMEHSGCEAIKNNVIGTYNTANAAEKYGVTKFILISTDKAVNPTNIMGASKRLCEMVVQCRVDSKTKFAAVRFGNVLGSNGSVIPLFKRQIAAGGPLTITDKRIIRYFMTIPEASQLVIQAGAKAKDGELFVLDMGQPVRIYDLAVNMIKLMGYEPDKDIEIKEIGLRQGEKLYEELLMKSEDLMKTDNDMIFIERDTPYTREQVEEKLAILKDAVSRSKDTVDSSIVKAAIKQVVPTFVDPEKVNKTAEQSEEMKNVKKEPMTV